MLQNGTEKTGYWNRRGDCISLLFAKSGFWRDRISMESRSDCSAGIEEFIHHLYDLFSPLANIWRLNPRVEVDASSGYNTTSLLRGFVIFSFPVMGFAGFTNLHKEKQSQRWLANLNAWACLVIQVKWSLHLYSARWPEQRVQSNRCLEVLELSKTTLHFRPQKSESPSTRSWEWSRHSPEKRLWGGNPLLEMHLVPSLTSSAGTNLRPRFSSFANMEIQSFRSHDKIRD